MKTFFVRACKKRKKRRNTFETWTRKRENGFRKNTSKKGEIKEKQKITVPSFDFFPSFYSSSFFISRSFRSRARRARVNHPRVGRKCSSTRFHATNNNLITFLAVLIFDRWRTLFLRPKAKASWKNKNVNSLPKMFSFFGIRFAWKIFHFFGISMKQREREGSIEYLHHLSLFEPDNLQYCFLDPSLEIPPP